MDAVLGDLFSDRNRCVETLTDIVEKVSALTGRTGVRLDYLEDALGEASSSVASTCCPCSLVYQLWVKAAYSRSKRTYLRRTLFVDVLGHELVFLENRVDAIDLDTDDVCLVERKTASG